MFFFWFILFYIFLQQGNAILQPLLQEEKVSTLKRFKPKPVVLPVDTFDSIYNNCKLNLIYLFFNKIHS